MFVDCQTCPVRGERCEDCVVSVLFQPGPTRMPLDPTEQRAVDRFVAAGMVSPSEAADLYAEAVPWGGTRAVG